MEKKLDEKSLVIKEKSFFYKIKTIFLRIFRKKEIIENQPQIDNKENGENQFNKQKDAFIESIKKIENDETNLLKLQKQYDEGLIETKDIPKEQKKPLIDLYKKQISELKSSNERRREKLLKKPL